MAPGGAPCHCELWRIFTLPFLSPFLAQFARHSHSLPTYLQPFSTVRHYKRVPSTCYECQAQLVRNYVRCFHCQRSGVSLYFCSWVCEDTSWMSERHLCLVWAAHITRTVAATSPETTAPCLVKLGERDRVLWPSRGSLILKISPKEQEHVGNIRSARKLCWKINTTEDEKQQKNKQLTVRVTVELFDPVYLGTVINEAKFFQISWKL